MKATTVYLFIIWKFGGGGITNIVFCFEKIFPFLLSSERIFYF